MATGKPLPARFKALLEHCNDGVLIAETPALTIHGANDVVCTSLDLRPENLIGRSLRDIISPSALSTLLGELIGGSASPRRSGKAATVLMGRHGLMVPVELTAKFDNAPDERFLVVMARDTRDRQRAESRMRRSERLYHLLSQHVVGFIWSANEKLELTFVSPSVLQTRGYSDEETMAQTLDQILTPSSHALLAGIFAEEQARSESPAAARAGVRTIELEMFRKNGSTFWTETSLSIYRRESGRALGFVALSRDITERRQADAERERMLKRLQQNQKRESLGNLAGGIAHQFNNILAGILGYAELIEEDLDQESPHYAKIRKIEAAAREASTLTRQMLAYAGHDNPRRSVLPVNPIVENMAQLLKASIRKDCELRIEPGVRLPRVEGDFSQLQQVVLNLVSNASDATGDRGGIIGIRTATVTINGEPPSTNFRTRPLSSGEYVLIDVVDDGCGIAAEEVPKLFEPFYSTKFTGRGLGLAAALGIVEAHGGCIEVHSTPGEGSRFRVFLPAAKVPRIDTPISAGIDYGRIVMDTPAAAGLKYHSPPIDTPTKRGPRAIVATSDETTLRVADRTLQSMGYHVEYVSENDALLPHLRSDRPPEVVLLDTAFGPMSSTEIVEEIRAIAGDAAILVCGEFGWSPDAQAPQDAAVAAVVKPLETAQMIAALRGILCSKSG